MAARTVSRKAKAARPAAPRPARKVEARKDAPKPVKGRARKEPLRAKEILRNAAKRPAPKVQQDQSQPQPVHAKQLLKQLGKQQFVFRGAASTATFEEKAFMDFFGPEIEAELERTATIFNDRFARWRCQCCDTVIPVPRRTEVFHGDYHLIHDDVLGLLVNGERWVPNAETPVEVVQPGRIRNPWTGELVKPGRHAV
jgi:hypothetical protein